MELSKKIKNFPRKLLFVARVGSRLYGTYTKDSDEDFVGIFMPNKEDLLGIHPYEEQDLSTKKSNEERKNNKKDVDFKCYSLRKFIHLLTNNNPNIVEMLFVDNRNIIIDSVIYRELQKNYDKFISRKVEHSFTGYAYSQMKKLHVKKERYESLKEAIDYMDEQFGKDKSGELHEFQASNLNRIIKHYKNTGNEIAPFHKGLSIRLIYDRIRTEYEEYGWRTKTSTFLDLGYDVKFAYHAMRLMLEGLELMERGKLYFPFTWEDLAYLKRIRKGKLSLEQIQYDFEEANETAKVVSKYNCYLREKPDMEWINNWLIETQYKGIINEL